MGSLDIPSPQEGPPTEAPPPLPARRELWSFRDLLLFLSFAAISIPLSGFVVTALYVAIHRAEGARLPAAGIQASAFVLIALQLLVHALILIYIFLLIRVQYQRPFWETLRWRWPSLAKTFEYTFGGLLMGVLVEFAPTLLPDKSTFPLEKLFNSPQAAYATGAFAVLVAPFMEELIFRGVLFAFFERFAGVTFAVITTAVLFTALHISEYSGAWNHLALLLIVGLVFSAARGWSGSLVPSVILHTSYNLLQMFMLFITTDHFRSLPGLS